MKITVLSVASHQCLHFDAFLRSCQRQGFEPIILGTGSPFRGYGYRLKVIREHVLATSASEDIVIHCDAFDSIFVGHPHGIARDFLRMNAPIVFSAERNCWPDADKARLYPPSPTPYRFLCAGGWIAYARELMTLLDVIEVRFLPDDADDQREFTKAYLGARRLIHLDHHCTIFQSLRDSENDIVMGDSIRNHITGSTPKIIHGNGLSNIGGVIEFLERKTS